MSFPFPSNPTVLITGANQGLGLGILTQLCKQRPSWSYVLGCRNVAAGTTAAADLRALQPDLSLNVLELDVTNDAHLVEAAALIETVYGKLDVLVNNAGALYPPGAGEMSAREVLNATLDLNATSPMLLTAKLMPLLHRSADPKVICVTSGTSSMARVLDRTVPATLAYGGSKVALNGFVVQLQALEWARTRKKENDTAIVATRTRAMATMPDATLRTRAMSAMGIDAASLGDEAPPLRVYAVAPGVTRTTFTNQTIGRDPEVAADVVVRLALDEEQKYPGGTLWEVSDEGEMRQVPW